MPQINGLLETQLWVEDMERSLRFYQEVFGFEQIDGGPEDHSKRYPGDPQQSEQGFTAGRGLPGGDRPQSLGRQPLF